MEGPLWVFLSCPKGNHFMPAKFCDAYDTKTGQKLPHKVPESHFALFKNIAPTPRQRASNAAVYVRPANADSEKEK